MNLLFRADASAEIGTGHLMRCLALAQAWQETGGQAVFVLASQSPALEARLKSEGFGVSHLAAEPGSAKDAQATIAHGRQHSAEWLVVDGYQFGAEYQQIVKQAGLRLLVIDDYGHAEHYFADLVLNQNISASETVYARREPYTQLLLGTRYALLRREFWPWRGWQRKIPRVARKVLVTLGGGDPGNATLKVVEALGQVRVDELEAVVVVGASNLHAETLKAASAALKVRIEMRSNVTNMPELMAWADVAVSAGGSTCWELAFLGLPSLILVLADNQRRITEDLHQAGITVNLGWQQDRTPADIAMTLTQLMPQAAKRQAMATAGQALVDGDGAGRVVMPVRDDRFRLRPVRSQDCRLIWEWANDPETRAASFSPEPIAWEDHVSWFEAKRQDARCLYYVAIDRQDEAIGQIRFDCRNREAVISVGLAASFRRQGYGSALIQQASRQVLERAEADVVLAYIKPDNEASRHAFLKAGYHLAGECQVGGHPALLFSLSKEEAK